MKIGYARVSTEDQSLDLQIDYLEQNGCDTIYKEKFTGKTRERPELKKALDHLKAGDTLVCLKLDRLGRSMKDLIDIVDQIKTKGCHFKTSDGIDTSTHMGTFIFHIFGAMAQMEVELIRERTLLGLKAARERGRIGGRPKGVSEKLRTQEIAVQEYYLQGKNVLDICTLTNLSSRSIYVILEKLNISLRNTKRKNKKCTVAAY
jgi:DNA invertase Pin-like site-specific DNA recombinase